MASSIWPPGSNCLQHMTISNLVEEFDYNARNDILFCKPCVKLDVESFTVESRIKGHNVHKDVWSSFKCGTIAVMKEVEKWCRHLTAAKSAEMCILQSTCKWTLDIG